MINWILGGVIVGVTIFIIVRTIRRMRNEGCSCCGGCAERSCRNGKYDCAK